MPEPAKNKDYSPSKADNNVVIEESGERTTQAGVDFRGLRPATSAREVVPPSRTEGLYQLSLLTHPPKRREFLLGGGGGIPGWPAATAESLNNVPGARTASVFNRVSLFLLPGLFGSASMIQTCKPHEGQKFWRSA